MPADLKRLTFDGLGLTYIESGVGPVVLFVHGAVADHRVWELQQGRISEHYRFVALDQRYFGAAPWHDDGSGYSPVTHARDLEGFVTALGSGPVHIVGWSYGGTIALLLALSRPEVVRSLFLYEPTVPSIVDDPQDRKTLAAERKGLAPVVAALEAGDEPRAMALMYEWVEGSPEGSLEQLRPTIRNTHLENARTIRPHLAAPQAPISCAQLGQLQLPVTVAMGERTRPVHSIVAHRVRSCIGSARMVVIAGARHGGPVSDSMSFNAALLEHLRGI